MLVPYCSLKAYPLLSVCIECLSFTFYFFSSFFFLFLIDVFVLWYLVLDITNRMVTEDAALAACHRNCQAWRELRCNTQASGDGTNEDVDFQDPVAVLPSVRDAFVWLCQLHNEAFQNSGEGQRRCSEPVPVALRSADHLQVLVVGSLHLVGTVLSVIRDSCSAEDGAGS